MKIISNVVVLNFYPACWALDIITQDKAQYFNIKVLIFFLFLHDFVNIYCIRPNYHTVHLGFSKLGKLVVKYVPTYTMGMYPTYTQGTVY